MDVRIQAIHFDATAQLEAFIQKKVSKLEQYFDGIILAEVTLKVVKPETVKNKQASIMLSVKNGECFADKINDTFEGAKTIVLRLWRSNWLNSKKKSEPNKKNGR